MGKDYLKQRNIRHKGLVNEAACGMSEGKESNLDHKYAFGNHHHTSANNLAIILLYKESHLFVTCSQLATANAGLVYFRGARKTDISMNFLNTQVQLPQYTRLYSFHHAKESRVHMCINRLVSALLPTTDDTKVTLLYLYYKLSVGSRNTLCQQYGLFPR